MIEKYCDNWKILWWLKNIMMMKKYCKWKIEMRMRMAMRMIMIISSIVNEVVKTILFFYEKILLAQKVQKNTYKQTKIKKEV